MSLLAEIYDFVWRGASKECMRPNCTKKIEHHHRAFSVLRGSSVNYFCCEIDAIAFIFSEKMETADNCIETIFPINRRLGYILKTDSKYFWLIGNVDPCDFIRINDGHVIRPSSDIIELDVGGRITKIEGTESLEITLNA